MANTSVVYARIDTELKEKAEGILAELGVSQSSAITMFYKQIVRENGLPLNLHLASNPPSEDSLTKEQLKVEIAKGLKDIEEGKTYSQEEVSQILKKEFGI